jgi:hypothetical protein
VQPKEVKTSTESATESEEVEYREGQHSIVYPQTHKTANSCYMNGSATYAVTYLETYTAYPKGDCTESCVGVSGRWSGVLGNTILLRQFVVSTHRRPRTCSTV